MAKEKRDNLFDLGLGSGLIEIPDDQGKEEETNLQDEGKKKDQKKADEGVTINDDGSFEIDEFLETEEDTSTEEDDEEPEEDKKITDKKNKEKTPSDKGSGDSSPSSSPYLAFAKDRAEEGVFLDFTDEQWTMLVERNDGDEAAALRELSVISMQQMVNAGVEKYKQSLTPEEKLLYEAKEKGVPLDEYSVAKRNAAKYSKITADQVKEDPKIAEDVLTKFLELRGFTSDEIKEEIEGYKALENLESKALKALEYVPKAFDKKVKDLETQAEAKEQEKKDKIAQRVAKMKGLIENTPEIIPGIKLNKTNREKIMESMTVPVQYDKEGNPLNPVMVTRQRNPEGFEMLIHYYHQLGLFNIDENGKIAPDFSKVSKAASTKTVDSLRSIFESTGKTSAGKAKIPKTKDDEEDEFDKAFSRIGR